MVQRLLALRGIGEVSAWIYTTEFFAWREFKNRRQVGAAAGLTATLAIELVPARLSEAASDRSALSTTSPSENGPRRRPACQSGLDNCSLIEATAKG
jgi:hypothetical protein